MLIYGAGAIGSFVGYLLSEMAEDRKAPQDCAVRNVALLGRKGHIRTIKRSGLKINMPEGSRSLRFNYTFSSLKELDRSDFRPELVVVCVKVPSLPDLRAEIMSLSALGGCLKGADLVLLMNGLGNREALDLPLDRVYQGFTSLGVQFFQDGVIDLKGIGPTFFEDGIPEKVRSFLSERFNEKGFVVEFSPDFKSLQWKKLMVNAVANPISAIVRKKNEATLSRDLEPTVEVIVDECLAVAALEGIEMDRESALEFVRSIISKNSQNTTSMFQDVLKGKRTEIESINGYVVRQAGKHGMRVPVNEALYALIKTMEEKSVK